MTRTPFLRAGLLLLVVAGGATAAPAPDVTTTTIPDRDRTTFLPGRKYAPLPGKAVGLLVGNVRTMMGREGRSGPPDALAFSRDGNSYSWVYVPAEGKPRITNLNVAVGTKGDQHKVYPALDMATPDTVKRWGITTSYALVEVEVNDGLGAPADQSFVATRMKRLDGTADYPLDVEKVLADLGKRNAEYVKGREKAIDAALKGLQKTVLKGRKLTGPRETTTVFYATWMPATKRLRAHFLTRVTEGAYQYGNGTLPRPVPLPLPPRPGGAGPTVRPTAPPPEARVRFGTTLTAEFGIGYEVSQSGKVQKVLVLPLATSHQETPPPPGAAGVPKRPLPPRK